MSVSGCGKYIHPSACVYMFCCLCVLIHVCVWLCVCACPLTHISSGTLQASRDEEVLEVKTDDLVFQRQLLLHGGGHASGSRPSQAHTIAKYQDEASAGLGGKDGLKAGRIVMGRESTVKSNAILLFGFVWDFLYSEALC